MNTETVLIVGATGNIGVAATQGALSSGRNVLAIVRNSSSADKLTKRIGSSQGITFVEADIASETGVESVVDRVKKGELPSFQHVYFCVGADYTATPLSEISTETFKYNMTVGSHSGFYAYRATIKYLLEKNHPNSTWTICTGSQGDLGIFAMPAMTQGMLFSMCKAACRECENTNVRFNEVYLCFRVEHDEDAKAHGVTSSSEFGRVYKQLLEREDVKSTRVTVETPEDIATLKFAKW